MARRKEFDQNKILDKAIELFWRQGYHATSIRHLVAHLGISRSTLYARALARFLFSAMQGLQVTAKTRPERQVLHDIVKVTLSVLK